MKMIDTITISELNKMAAMMYAQLVKAVVDVDKGLMVVDAELHVDQKQYLPEHGSRQEDLWGINLYPEKHGTDEFIEFDSMINIRPQQQNMSRGVDDEETRKRIISLVRQKVNP